MSYTQDGAAADLERVLRRVVRTGVVSSVDFSAWTCRVELPDQKDGDGNPLPSFKGEPKLVSIPDDIEGFTNLLWSSLNADNKISLFVRFIDPENGSTETRIVNRYGDTPKNAE